MTEQSAAQRITKREQIAILASSAVAALSTFVATWIANFALPAAQVTEFLLFWAALFGVFGIVAGIASEATRAVGAARLAPATPSATTATNATTTMSAATPAAAGSSAAAIRGASVALTAGAIGGAVALLIALSSPLWVGQIATTAPGATVVLLVAGVALYAVHSAASGAAAGSNSWFLYAFLGGGEAAWRLVAMALVTFLAGSLISLEAAVVSPVLLWLVLALTHAPTRRVLLSRADVNSARLLRNMLFAILSSAASAVLMTGFPLVLRFSEQAAAHSEQFLVLGALILAVSICRSPIMIPLQAFQGVAIAAFLKQRHRPLQAFMRPAVALTAVGAVGALLAALVGPFLFLLIYPPKHDAVTAYHTVAQPWVLAALTAASAVMALLVLSGTAILALNGHTYYAAGWIIAAAATTALVFLVPLPLIERTIIALFLGPATGVLLHLLGMRRLAWDHPGADRLDEAQQPHG